MSMNLVWKLGPSTGTKNQPRGKKPVNDPAPESENQPGTFQSPTNVGGPQKESQVAKTGQLQQSLSSPVKIFAAERNKNSSSPSTAAAKNAASRSQRQPWKQKRNPHLKIKEHNEIMVQKLELEKNDQNEHQSPDQIRDEKDPNKIWEEVVGKHKTPDQKRQEKEVSKNREQVDLKKHKVPVEENPKKNGLEKVQVHMEPVKAAFINNFSPTLTWEEIKEDFLLMTGKRPPRNPKKKNLLIKDLYPGNRLDEVCAAIYIIEGKDAFCKNQRGQ